MSGLTLCQDLVTDSPELALEVAEEIVYRFRERGRGVIGGGFVVHLLCLEIGLGRLRWLCLRSEGVGSLEECSVRHGLIACDERWMGQREGARLELEDRGCVCLEGRYEGYMLTDASFVDIISCRRV